MTPEWPSGLARSLATLCAAPHLLVCTDYDGTLAPIASRPEDAQLLPGALALLEALAYAPATRVAVISGRSLQDLRRHSGAEPPVILIGSHGAESSLDHLPAVGADQLVLLDRLHTELERLCDGAPGAWVERKPFSAVVHVRQCDRADAGRLLAEIRTGAALWPGLQVTSGKEVLELSVVTTNKGEALTRVRDAWGTNPRVLYIGDDVTDEMAFGALRATDVGVKVGAEPSIAQYRVASEASALSVLDAVCAERRNAREG